MSGNTWWQDFVFVTASLGGTDLTTNYTVSPAYNQTQTYLGKAGVIGLQDVNSNSPLGNVGVSFTGGNFDTITIGFLQGGNATRSDRHSIAISNIELVPEPTTAALALAGIAFTVLRFRRRLSAKA